MTVESLPHFVECDDCDLKHFLSVNRDAYGRWSAGYIAYDEDGERGILCINDAETLVEVAIRLSAKLKRYEVSES